jgi:hypothetical protein
MASKYSEHIASLTKVTLVECLLRPGSERAETAQPVTGFCRYLFVERVDTPRPWPICEAVGQIEHTEARV